MTLTLTPTLTLTLTLTLTQNAILASARGRLPHRFRTRLTALAGSALSGERRAHSAPSHCLGRSS